MDGRQTDSQAAVSRVGNVLVADIGQSGGGSIVRLVDDDAGSHLPADSLIAASVPSPKHMAAAGAAEVSGHGCRGSVGDQGGEGEGEGVVVCSGRFDGAVRRAQLTAGVATGGAMTQLERDDGGGRRPGNGGGLGDGAAETLDGEGNGHLCREAWMCGQGCCCYWQRWHGPLGGHVADLTRSLSDNRDWMVRFE